MGLIYKQVRLAGSRASRVFTALMDTGASESFIRREEALLIGRPFRTAEPLRFELGKGALRVNRAIFALVYLDDHRLPWTFYMVAGLTEELYLGADFFQRWKIKLDPETEEILFDPKALKLKLAPVQHNRGRRRLPALVEALQRQGIDSLNALPLVGQCVYAENVI